MTFKKNIIILIAIMLLGSIGYIAKSKLGFESSKDWKTYKNEQYGFEFKYPKEVYLGTEAMLSTQNESDYIKDLNKGLKDVDFNKPTGLQTLPSIYGGTVRDIRVGVIDRENTLAKGDKKIEEAVIAEAISKYGALAVTMGNKKAYITFGGVRTDDPYEIFANVYNNNGDNIYLHVYTEATSTKAAKNTEEFKILLSILPTFKFNPVNTKSRQNSPVGFSLTNECRVVGWSGDNDPSIGNVKDYKLNDNEWLVDCGSKNNSARGVMRPILEQQGLKFCSSHTATGSWWKDGVLTTVAESAGSGYPFRIIQDKADNCE